MSYCIVLPSYGSQAFFENCLTVAVRSIHETNPELPIVIFHNGLCEKDKKKLNDCTFIEVDVTPFNVKHRSDLTEGTYFKFYIEKLTQYERVLYLDADTIVLGDLLPLLEIDAPLGARTRSLPLSHEFHDWKKIAKLESITEGDPILQGGVVCFNPQFWAKERLLDQVFELSHKYGWFCFKNADQGILNILAHRYKDFVCFPCEYNYCRYWDMLKKKVATIKENSKGLKLAYQENHLIKVLHWNGKIKPYEFDSAGFDKRLQKRLLHECYKQFC